MKRSSEVKMIYSIKVPHQLWLNQKTLQASFKKEYQGVSHHLFLSRFSLCVVILSVYNKRLVKATALQARGKMLC